jgi:L-fuculose-phosphate aldolase
VFFLVSIMNRKQLKELRRTFVLVGRRIFEEKLTSGSGGQISARIPDSDLVMIKPSGFSMGYLKPADMVIIDLNGNKIRGKYKPSSEWPFHTALYKARPNIGAVVHAHPLYATAFGIAGKELLPIWCEAFALVRGVPVVPYTRSATQQLANAIVQKMGDKYAVILQNHGIVAVGPRLEDAYQTARDVEWVAQMQFVATRFGEPKQLDPSEIERIAQKFAGRPMGELKRTYGNV